jgi:spectinomycin phosphotransferase
VLTPPPDLDATDVARLVRDEWALPVSECRYLAEGMGSHHWLGFDEAGAERWFITADRVRTAAAAKDLQACFTVACWLADKLPFVLGPQAAADGSVTHPADPGGSLLVSVRDYLAGESGRFGAFTNPDVLVQVLRALAQLHALAVPDLLPRWQPANYEGIRSAIRESDVRWAPAGPFAEAARQLVRANAETLTRRLHDFDAACVDLLSDRQDVISHGEPHASNVLVLTPDVRRPALASPIALLDWDTVRAAPRERDLAVALPDTDSAELPASVRVYLDATGGLDDLDHDVIALFREEWALNDIDVYLAELRAPHGDTADTQAALRFLGNYVTGGS